MTINPHEASPGHSDRPHNALIDERQAEAIDTLADSVAYKGKSRLAILKALPRKRKWAYFRDQLLARTAILLAALLVAIYLIAQMLTPTPAPRLYVAVINGALGTQDATTLQAHAAKALNLPEGRAGGVTVDANFSLDETGLTKLQTMLSADEIDVIIANHKDFRTLAGYGYMRPLDTALTSEQHRTLGNVSVSFKGFDDSDGTSMDYDGSGKGQAHPYGLKLTHATQWSTLRSSCSTALAGFAQDSRNEANAQRFVSFIAD